MYCKLPTNGKQLPAFPLTAMTGIDPRPSNIVGVGNKIKMGKGQLHSENMFNNEIKNVELQHGQSLCETNTVVPRCMYIPAVRADSVGFIQHGYACGSDPPVEHLTGEGAVRGDHVYLQAAIRVADSGTYNCDGMRIPVGSRLNLANWARYLNRYKDRRLLQFLVYGFPLGRTAKGLNRMLIQNHKSAKDYPEAIDEFLTKEVAMGAILGPFDKVTVEGCHVSPLMTRPKDGNKRRVIVDLSFGDHDSVNGTTVREIYDGHPFSLPLPNLDYLIHDILQCEGDLKFMKIDIARAFRNVRIDPADALKLGICHKGKFYIDKSLAFGTVPAPLSFREFLMQFDAY